MAMKSTAGDHGQPAKGRGSPVNPEGRFETTSRESVDDGWFPEETDEPARPGTVVTLESAKSIISRHDSPDLNFSQSINPYRGCAHGCCLLLRPPLARLPRPLARAGLRDAPLREARGGAAPARGARAPRLPLRADRHRHQYRRLPAHRARAPHHAFRPRGAARDVASGRDRHEVGAGGARPRSPRRDGEGPPRVRHDLGDHARLEALAAAWSRGRARRRAASRPSAAWRRPASPSA